MIPMPPCLICDKELEPAFPKDLVGNIYNQPYAATLFQSYGHYGSTVWDPMTGGRYIEVNICDECLIERKDRVIEVTTIPRPSAHEVIPWDPSRE